ncbi:MAG: SDR family NAD(P)-dependent oxidoreductase, partial [Defluviitaleaceae bacterium]|nr:SDR family NAD(P)-dependent oxidoreductase [Defluviitaleaceae bacterium]
MVLDLFKLNGKAAVVTGTSSGLGEAIAEALAQAGADVCGAARRESVNARKKVEAAGRRFTEVRIDFSEAGPVDAVIERCVEAFGRVDILVNNAGTIRRANAIDFKEADWDAVMNTNLKSLFFLSQCAAKKFIPRGGGKIINIASMLSFQGGVRVSSYTASKSGVMGLTRLMANEWA